MTSFRKWFCVFSAPLLPGHFRLPEFSLRGEIVGEKWKNGTEREKIESRENRTEIRELAREKHRRNKQVRESREKVLPSSPPL